MTKPDDRLRLTLSDDLPIDFSTSIWDLVTERRRKQQEEATALLEDVLKKGTQVYMFKPEKQEGDAE